MPCGGAARSFLLTDSSTSSTFHSIDLISTSFDRPGSSSVPRRARLNAVSAELSDAQRTGLTTLPCVASVSPVAQFLRREPQPVLAPVAQSLSKNTTLGALNYGPSFTQLNTINVIDVHAQGVNGTGVIIGMLDDGFNQHTVHPALKNIKVIAEYRFCTGRQQHKCSSGRERRAGESWSRNAFTARRIRQWQSDWSGLWRFIHPR